MHCFLGDFIVIIFDSDHNLILENREAQRISGINIKGSVFIVRLDRYSRLRPFFLHDYHNFFSNEMQKVDPMKQLEIELASFHI